MHIPEIPQLLAIADTDRPCLEQFLWPALIHKTFMCLIRLAESFRQEPCKSSCCVEIYKSATYKNIFRMQSSYLKARHLLQSTTPTQQNKALCSLLSRSSRRGSCLVPLQARRWSCRASLVCSAAAGLANGPKTGLVGPERCKFAGQHKML